MKNARYILFAVSLAAGCSNQERKDYDLDRRTVKVNKLGVYEWADIVISEISREEGEGQLLERASIGNDCGSWFFVQRNDEKPFFVCDVEEYRAMSMLGYSLWSSKENLGLKAVRTGDRVTYYVLLTGGRDSDDAVNFLRSIPTGYDLMRARKLARKIKSSGAMREESRSVGPYGVLSFSLGDDQEPERLQASMNRITDETIMRKGDSPLPEKIDACSRKLRERGVTLRPIRNGHITRR